MLAFQLRFVPILFLLICLVSRTESQPLTYKGTYVDTVKVLSNFGYYHFDSLGTSTGEGEEYFIAFNTKRNGYFLVQHKKTSYKYINTTEVFSSQEKLLKSGIDVYIVTSQHLHHFRDSNEYLYIHHWYEFSDEKFVIPPPIVNFPIDKALIKVLPRNFYGLRSLHTQMLANAYIAWYMKRRDIDIN